VGGGEGFRLFVKVLLLLVTGLAAGFIGGLLGIGGCVIMLPALYFLFNYPLPLAIGTTITAVILTATSGAIAHLRIKNVDFSTVKIISLSGAAGAVVGSLVFAYIIGRLRLLKAILGFAFLYVAVRMVYEGFFRRHVKAKEGKEVPGSTAVKGILGFCIGVLTGIIGLGGGYALVPSFIYLLDAPVKIAVGTSLPSFISMAVISGAFKLYQGVVDLVAAAALGVGTIVGAQVGARVVPKAPSWAIKALFGVVFLYVSLKFVLSALGFTI